MENSKKKSFKETFIRNPISIILTSLLITEIIVRICDYFINRSVNSVNDFFISNYSLRALPFIPVLILVIIGFIMVIILSKVRNIATDIDMLLFIFKEAVISKVILSVVFFTIMEVMLSFLLVKMSDLSMNYAIHSLNDIGSFFIRIYSLWFTALIMFFLMKDPKLRIIQILCPVLTIVLLYRVIISNFFISQEDFTNGLLSDAISGELGGLLGFIISAESSIGALSDLLFNILCTVSIISIYYILKKSLGTVNRITRVSLICSIAIFVISFTPIPKWISYLKFFAS